MIFFITGNVAAYTRMFISVLNNKWLMRFFVAFSTFYGFCYVADMHSYFPLWKSFAKGLEMTMLGHLGLWLAMLQVKGSARFLVAVILFASLLGLYVLWHELHFVVAIVGVAYTSWILLQTIRGKPIGN